MARNAGNDGGTAGTREVRKSAVAAGTISDFVEWYDFATYAYSSPEIATLLHTGSNAMPAYSYRLS